jgi:hypothetical protein
MVNAMDRKFVLLVACLVCQDMTVFAGEADVVKVDVEANSQGVYNFAVTVSHEDTGWEHYADRWEIVDSDGNILETRVLHHPHVNEQPFTRNLPGVKVPGHLNKLTVRAHDSVHGYGGKVVSVDRSGRN